MHKAHRKKRKRGKGGSGCQQNVSGGKENAEPRGCKTNIKHDNNGSNLNNNRIVSENSEKSVAQRDDGDPVLPYEIRNSEVMGRYLVASRDLKPGDLIIKTDPLVVGPCAGCDIICLGCYQPIVAKETYRCTRCRWPLCGPTCSGLHQTLGHSVQECAVLEKQCCLDGEDIKDLYHAIVPLRCLILKASDPEKWKAINSMVAHNDIRRKKPELWKHNQSMVVDRIRKVWNMPQYTENEIHTICGILEVNAFEVGPLGASLRALYPRAYLLAHDCTPNTTHTDDALRRLSVRAARPIRQGQPITLSYAYTLQSTHKRREHLLESKFFECTCSRCSDPLELGTYAGALLCPRCTTNSSSGATSSSGANNSNKEGSKAPGIVLPTDPLDQTASWKCGTCTTYVLSASIVNALVQKISDEFDGIDANDLDRYESFLRRYRNVLHPNHCLCLSAKLALSQLYGKIDSHLIHKMSPLQLERKRDICKDILKVFDIIEPGLSRLRGTTLYELHAPLMVLTTRDYEKRDISKPELRTRLIEVARCLDESAKILDMEPKDSSEGIMASAAKDALRQIKDWEKIIGKIL